MIEHCISSLKLNKEKKQYQIYVTDALMAIANNTTHLVGAQGVVDYGTTLTKRWVEIGKTVEVPKEDDRPADVIASDIWERIRGK